MLQTLGLASLDELIEQTVPASILRREPLDLPPARSEAELLRALKLLGSRNRVARSFIGMGYYDCVTPPVILRNVPGEPRLVHAVHPLPVGDLSGAARGAAELPDDGERPHRTAARERISARRSDRGGGGVGDVPSPGPGQGRLLRRGRLSPADAGGGSHACRSAQHLVAGRRLDEPGSRDRRHLRRARAVPDYRWPTRRLPRACRAGAPGRRPPGRRDGSAGVDARASPGRVRSRYRRRLVAAIRRADGLRRAARGVHRHPRRVPTPATGPPRRGLARRGRGARLPAGAADPRAAHSPRQGDEQHLHGAGAACGDGIHVRRLPRAGRPALDRASRARPGSRAGVAPAERRARSRARALLRHAPRRRRGRPGPSARRGRRGSAATTCASSTRALSGSLWTKPQRRRISRGCSTLSVRRRLPARGRPRTRSDRSRVRATSSATRCSGPTARSTRCCATCTGSRRATSHSRPR